MTTATKKEKKPTALQLLNACQQTLLLRSTGNIAKRIKELESLRDKMQTEQRGLEAKANAICAKAAKKAATGKWWKQLTHYDATRNSRGGNFRISATAEIALPKEVLPVLEQSSPSSGLHRIGPGRFCRG